MAATEPVTPNAARPRPHWVTRLLGKYIVWDPTTLLVPARPDIGRPAEQLVYSERRHLVALLADAWPELFAATVGPLLLGFFGAVILVGVGLIAWRVLTGQHPFRAEDPRARHMREGVKRLSEEMGQPQWYEILEATVEAMKPYARLGVAVNVDFYAGVVYYLHGIPEDLFVPIFAIGRPVALA